MDTCRFCKSEKVTLLFDFGKMPVANRFLVKPQGEEFLHLFKFGYCPNCRLLQLLDPPAADELAPRYDWIAYNEPEAHLDELADIICDKSGLKPDSLIRGISIKDDSLLARLKKRGFTRTLRLDLVRDLGIKQRGAGVEAVQERLSAQKAEELARKYGKADFVIARHILEHSFDAGEFLRALKTLAKDGGRILIEVPDCLRAFDGFDYTTLWEEHIFYFTPDSFKRGFLRQGFRLEHYGCFPYPFENALTALLSVGTAREKETQNRQETDTEIARLKVFFGAFSRRKEEVQQFLRTYRAKSGKIAVFGAGHLACTFINLFGLSSLIECVIDDNPRKKGLFMPLSRLPILSSYALVEKGIRLCLLAVSPQSEDKVVSNNRLFSEQGGEFVSIFPGSKRALNMKTQDRSIKVCVQKS